MIEMLIVMAIIALLLTIAVPRYFGSIEKSKDVALRENLKALRVTLDNFYADKGRYPESLDELVEQRYLRNVPVDPVTDSSTTWILVPGKDGNVPGITDVKSGAPGHNKEGIAYGSF